ncbi:MAG: hydroxymethylglutaryl-CoA synthase [Cardiobacteriaceae bacterium]|nr:hydroxymethylglutaryl-CoA synthase [Cardiobacteriaceae bacterium]
MRIGINRIGFATARYYLDMDELSAHNQTDPNKYRTGLGQDKIAICPPDEDIVTLACKALSPIAASRDLSNVDTLLFATESGIDQSKAAGIYVQKLMNLPKQMRIVELKQACYSATAALQLARSYVAEKPSREVLVIASDIARYDRDSAAEATQGAGAVAMLITQNPEILEIEPISGLYSEDIMDFFRPNHRKTPLVDGRFSTTAYLKALEGAWEHYQQQGGLADFKALCYHLPFGKMGVKAHEKWSKLNHQTPDFSLLDAGLIYNRQIGNSYSASLYISLCSLLENREDLAGQRIGMFSYGSGCVSEFFSARVCEGYQSALFHQHHQAMLESRSPLRYEQYARWHTPDDGEFGDAVFHDSESGTPRLAAITQHQRRYQP